MAKLGHDGLIYLHDSTMIENAALRVWQFLLPEMNQSLGVVCLTTTHLHLYRALYTVRSFFYTSLPVDAKIVWKK
jgi:hypothetical protein